MSSMRNAVARRPHKERAQPLERRRLGLLEKHKDYSERAKDYNKKKKTLKSLRQKATERNDDEFYFGMMSRNGPGAKITTGKGWTGKVHGDRGNKSLDVNAVRLLKTQDIGYVRTMKQVISKEVARLEEQVVLTRGLDRLDENDEDEDEDEDDDFSDLDDMPKGLKKNAPRKITFLETEEERETVLDNVDEDEEDGKSSGKDDKEKEAQEFERERSLRRLKKQLDLSRKKLKALKDAEGALEEQQAKMAKTATSGGTSRRGKKLMVRARKR